MTDTTNMDKLDVFTDPDGRVWHPHRGYWCYTMSQKVAALEAENKALRGALVDPSDDMIEAGEEDIQLRRQYGVRIYAADIWRVMANRALGGDHG